MLDYVYLHIKLGFRPVRCTPLLYKPMYSLIVKLSIIIIIANLH